MRALTIKQPWAFAIAEAFDGSKDVENRTWYTKYRGPLAIHAGAGFDHDAILTRYGRAAAGRLDELGGRGNFWDALGFIPSKIYAPPHPTLAMSAIIAVATLVDCHRCDTACSSWAEPGVWHWTLADVRPLPAPVPCKGRLQLWNVPDDVLAAVRAQLAEAAS